MTRTWIPVLVAALACVLLLWRLDRVSGELEAERTAHGVTAAERNHWRTAAEAYRLDAEAQAENAPAVPCAGDESRTRHGGT